MLNGNNRRQTTMINYAFVNEYVDVTTIHFKSAAWVLILPLLLMAMDTITGLIKSWATESFQSRKMRTGLSKKAGEISIIIIGELFQYALGLPPQIMTCISLYITFMELMSNAENLNTIGVPLPAFITKVLQSVDDSLQKEDLTEVISSLNEINK